VNESCRLISNKAVTLYVMKLFSFRVAKSNYDYSLHVVLLKESK